HMEGAGSTRCGVLARAIHATAPGFLDRPGDRVGLAAGGPGDGGGEGGRAPGGRRGGRGGHRHGDGGGRRHRPAGVRRGVLEGGSATLVATTWKVPGVPGAV